MIGTLAVDGWAVTFVVRDCGPAQSPLAVPNVTAQPSTASVSSINLIVFDVALYTFASEGLISEKSKYNMIY